MLVLDTNLLIGLLRQYPAALKWFKSVVHESPIIPGFVVMELVAGCKNKRELLEVDQLVKTFPVYWPTASEASNSLEYLKAYYKMSGRGIVDALIAACAIGLRAPLCTFDKDFRPVPRLKIIEPYVLPQR